MQAMPFTIIQTTLHDVVSSKIRQRAKCAPLKPSPIHLYTVCFPGSVFLLNQKTKEDSTLYIMTVLSLLRNCPFMRVPPFLHSHFLAKRLRRGTSSSRLLFKCANIKYALDVIRRDDMFGFFLSFAAFSANE